MIIGVRHKDFYNSWLLFAPFVTHGGNKTIGRTP
jgi:hypothetical protein